MVSLVCIVSVYIDGSFNIRKVGHGAVSSIDMGFHLGTVAVGGATTCSGLDTRDVATVFEKSCFLIYLPCDYGFI